MERNHLLLFLGAAAEDGDAGCACLTSLISQP